MLKKANRVKHDVLELVVVPPRAEHFPHVFESTSNDFVVCFEPVQVIAGLPQALDRVWEEGRAPRRNVRIAGLPRPAQQTSIIYTENFFFEVLARCLLSLGVQVQHDLFPEQMENETIWHERRPIHVLLQFVSKTSAN